MTTFFYWEKYFFLHNKSILTFNKIRVQSKPEITLIRYCINRGSFFIIILKGIICNTMKW